MGVEPAGRLTLAITRSYPETTGTDGQPRQTLGELVGDKRTAWRFLPSLERM